jgi:hypothetical protein
MVQRCVLGAGYARRQMPELIEGSIISKADLVVQAGFTGEHTGTL